MPAREIHAAARELLGEPPLWPSVNACLAADTGGRVARFERVGRGHYQRRGMS